MPNLALKLRLVQPLHMCSIEQSLQVSRHQPLYGCGIWSFQCCHQTARTVSTINDTGKLVYL